MPHSVRLNRAATDDLLNIAEWIADEAGVEIAFRYVDRIEAHCRKLAQFPLRGRLRRKDLGVRSMPFRRSAIILYRVDRSEVLILRILHSGRDIERDIAAIG